MQKSATVQLTVDQLALAVVREQSAALDERAAGARAGDDPKHVHQMRVATRRLRAAFRLFEDVLPPAAAELNDELRWVAATLGGVRDLDVQVAHTRACGEELGVLESLAPYVAWLGAQRQRAHGQLAEMFEDARYCTLVSRLGQLDVPPGELDVEADARRRVRKVARKLWKRADELGPASSAAEFHRARIAAKRLRYTAEFYERVYGEPAADLARRAVDVQDLLGEQQDTVVARERVMAALAASNGAWPADAVFALGRVVQRDAQRAAQLRSEFKEVYAPLRKAWKRMKRAL